MSFINIPWLSESLKKRALRYLLQRYLGHFLLEKLTLEQLSVDLYDGKGCIRDLALDVEGLNEELLFLPFKFTNECCISQINCSVPWSALMTEPCSLEIEGATLSCQVTGKDATEKNVYESSYLSKSMMSSSMQMAEEIALQTEPEEGKFDGLEMMAQLIDSVLRRVKLIATNTSFSIESKSASTVDGSSFKATGNTTRVEFKIKYLRCEEEILSEEDEKQKNINCNTPGIIDKLLTFEGVEVLINGRCVCKLGGKHMIKIKANETKSDLQLYVGSPLLAIITSDELKHFIDVFCPPPLDAQQSSVTNLGSSEKMMSSQDFARIEQQLQFDSDGRLGGSCIQQQQIMHPQSREQNTWTLAGSSNCDNEAKFLPLKYAVLDDDCDPCAQSSTSYAGHFSFFIKIPGIWLCMLDKKEEAPQASVPLVNSSFAAVNTFLDKILDKKNHIRVLALPIQMEITFTNISIITGDVMVLEQTSSGLVPILWSDDHSELINAPKYRCDIRGDTVVVDCKTTTCITLDPTILERMEDYFAPSKSTISSTAGPGVSLTVQVRCDNVKASLLFPVPDLRTEEERVEEEGMDGLRERSKLRDESLSILIEEFFLSTNIRNTSASCDSLKALFIQPDKDPVTFVHARRNPVEAIEFSISSGPGAVAVGTGLDLDEYGRSPGSFGDCMEESIYISSSESKHIEAFQIRRKVIKEHGNESESVIGPSDRENAKAFIEQARSYTQFQIELTVPSLDVTTDKKQLEVVYNRFGNDLVLWRPMKGGKVPEKRASKARKDSSGPTYFPCKSGLADSLDSESSFHSFDGLVSSRFQNFATCVFNVQEVNFNALLDSGPKQCVSGQQVFLGLVLGLDNETTNTIFICGEKATLAQDQKEIIASNTFADSTSSLNMTFQIHLETEELKKLKVALQVCDTSLQSTDHEIFKNFWDVVNVTDEVVLGYNPPSVLTELHISLMNGAIAIESPETRPAIFTYDDVYVTSMVVEKTSHTLFRIIIEEGSLFFSRSKKRPRSLKDCICVLDSGLTDLNLKVKDERVEFKISNNVINVRTCSDSFNALCELVTYLATPSGSVASPDHAFEFNSPTLETESLDGDLIKDALSDVNDNEDARSTTSNCSLPGDMGGMGGEGKIDESGFWILGDDDVGTGIKPTAEPQIRVLSNEPVKVVENHFGVTRSRPLPEILSTTLERYLLEELSVILCLFGGRDFDDEDKDVQEKNPFEKDYFEPKLGNDSGRDKHAQVRFAPDGTVNLWESLDLMSVPFRSKPGASTATGRDKSEGGRNRQNEICVQLYLSKIKSLYETFEPTFSVSWRFVIMINEIEIRDRVSSSRINKMLYEYCSESMPRRNNANMLYVKATSHKNSADNNDECSIKVSVKPLRINVDQDTLMFLVDFFGGVNTKASTFSASPPSTTERRGSTTATTTVVAKMSETQFFSTTTEVIVDTDAASIKNEDAKSTTSSSSSSRPSGLYVKSFIFAPDVPIRLDYQGKRLDFEQGALAGILMGLAQLNESELRLKRLCNKHGILGLDRVFLYAFNEWTKDIKRYQLPSLLGGVGPMHSFIQLFQGVRDLILMPIDQYRKDRRLVRGIQRGASSFSTSSAMAFLDLTNRMVYVIQNTAQFAHDVLAPHSNSRQLVHHSSQLPSSQPRDFREGMTHAYTRVRQGFNHSGRNVSSAYQTSNDITGAIGGVLSQIPSCVLQPVISLAEASSNVLVGTRNQIVPAARKQDQDKYKPS